MGGGGELLSPNEPSLCWCSHFWPVGDDILPVELWEGPPHLPFLPFSPLPTSTTHLHPPPPNCSHPQDEEGCCHAECPSHTVVWAFRQTITPPLFILKSIIYDSGTSSVERSVVAVQVAPQPGFCAPSLQWRHLAKQRLANCPSVAAAAAARRCRCHCLLLQSLIKQITDVVDQALQGKCHELESAASVCLWHFTRESMRRHGKKNVRGQFCATPALLVSTPAR